MELTPRTAALKAVLEAMPGAVGEPMTASRGKDPLVVLFKVMGKMFAILSVRGEEYVILKCDPVLAETLRGQYAGVGHRSHLDRRFWISVSLGADVPDGEIERLVAHSYDQVADGLTKKQKAELAALTGQGPALREATTPEPARAARGPRRSRAGRRAPS